MYGNPRWDHQSPNSDFVECLSLQGWSALEISAGENFDPWNPWTMGPMARGEISESPET